MSAGRYTVAEARAKPMPLHHIEWDVGTVTTATFTCDAPEGSLCRLTCAEDCGAETWPCGRDDEWDRGGHDMIDAGHCQVLPWLEAVDWDETFEDGAPDRPHPHNHLPYADIAVRWDGDGYVWRYPDPAAS